MFQYILGVGYFILGIAFLNLTAVQIIDVLIVYQIYFSMIVKVSVS